MSVALPASIIENAQGGELKAVLVGQIARALTIFSVDEVVLFEDQSGAPQSDDSNGLSRALSFFARNLQYLETPQYLRRKLLPMHRDLRWVGQLAPLDAPHHLRRNERLLYREGVVLPSEEAWPPPQGESGPGVWVDCGLWDPVWVAGHEIPQGLRVTVKIDTNTAVDGTVIGAAVPPDHPRTQSGLYWGYQVRIATSLRAVFDECPFDGGYDLTIGTSERGDMLGKVPKFKHLLVAFGGLGGLEEAVNDDSSGNPGGTDPSTLFKRYVNIAPRQTSRTIRTEEALMMTLSTLRPHLP